MKKSELLRKRTSFFSSIKSTNLEGKSLNILSDDNWLRKSLHSLIANKKFDYFIMLMIGLSSIELALYSPNKDPNG